MATIMSKNKKLAIYCAGGLGKEILDLARRNNDGKWQEIFFVDDIFEGKKVNGAKVIKFSEINQAESAVIEFVVANGEPFVKEILCNKIVENGFALATLIDKTAIIADSAVIGAGSVVASNCFVSSNSIVGKGCMLQPTSNIGHDSMLGDYVGISSFVSISGHCTIGNCVYIGVSVPVKEGTSIGEGSIVGMGAVVVNNIPEYMIALGNPARPMKRNENKRVFN